MSEVLVVSGVSKTSNKTSVKRKDESSKRISEARQNKFRMKRTNELRQGAFIEIRQRSQIELAARTRNVVVIFAWPGNLRKIARNDLSCAEKMPSSQDGGLILTMMVTLGELACRQEDCATT